MSKLPERIGKYKIVAHIGRGGMGSVYKAHDPDLDRMVAVKVMTEEAGVDSDARARFMREAQSAARLNHPNIITVYELGEERGRVFIVMELLEGEPLSGVIERVPPLPLRQKLALMIQICEGLAFAHQRGVVHRDIKPGNVFVLETGQVKILDFGTARLMTSDLTRTGFLIGTPNYMSPEQARGRRTDARTDIFSAGVVFYELLTARKPFAGSDYFETLEKLRSEEPTWLGEIAPTVPGPLVDAVHRALEKDLAERYQTIDALRGDLVSVFEGLEAESAAALREAVGMRLAEVVRLHRKLVAAVGAAALGDEKLPVAELNTTDAGLRTLLRKLDEQSERLQAFARDVERLEPAVERGIAAAERGAYTEAAAELDAVLGEMPLHQRAREYRDRVRHEEELERTAEAFGMRRSVALPPPPPRGAVPVAPARAAAPSDGPWVLSAPVLAYPPPKGTGVVLEDTEVPSGGRGRLVLVVVAVVAVVGGAAVLFGPLHAPRDRGVPPKTASAPQSAPTSTEPATAALKPEPAPAPAAVRPASPSAEPSAAQSERRTTPAPTASTPVPARRPSAAAPSRTGDVKASPKPPASEPKPASKPPPPKAAAVRPVLTAEQDKALEDAVTLAQLFQARGDHVRALREYRRALDIDPTHPEAKQGLAAVEQALRSER